MGGPGGLEVPAWVDY